MDWRSIGHRGGEPRTERLALEFVRIGVARAGRSDAGGLRIDGELLAPSVQSLVPELAAIHRVGGALLTGLDGVDGVSEELRSALAGQRRQWTARHLATMRSLAEIGSALDALGARWMVYKGPLLAAEVYPHPGDRAYGDLDLVVHPRDLGAAVAALERLGFEHGNHHWRHAEWVGRAEFPMARGDLMVDVHWHLQYGSHERADLRLDLDALHADARRVDAPGCSISAPSPEDSLMLTAFHACRSGGHRLIWSKDVERLLAVGSVDAGRFVERARAANLAGQVAVAIDRAAALLETDASPVVGALGARSLVGTERLVRRWSSPLRADERGTLARAWSRSVRGTAVDSTVYVARRGRQRIKELVARSPESRWDDESEKQAFLRWVAEQA